MEEISEMSPCWHFFWQKGNTMNHSIEFGSLRFSIENDRIHLKSLADYPVNGGFAEVTVSGENKHTHQGATMIPSSEGSPVKNSNAFTACATSIYRPLIWGILRASASKSRAVRAGL